MAMSRGPAPDWLGFWFDTQCSGAKFYVCQATTTSAPAPTPALSPPPSPPPPPPPTPPRCVARGVTWCTDSTGQGGNCFDHGSCSLDAARLLPDPTGIAIGRAVCQPPPQVSPPSPPAATCEAVPGYTIHPNLVKADGGGNLQSFRTLPGEPLALSTCVSTCNSNSNCMGFLRFINPGGAFCNLFGFLSTPVQCSASQFPTNLYFKESVSLAPTCGPSLPCPSSMPSPVSANMRPCNDPNTWTCPPFFSECITRYSNLPSDPPNVSNCNRVRNYMISSGRISGEQCQCA